MKIANHFRREFWASARARLVYLVLLTMLPALGVQLYGTWSDVQQNLADRKAEATREMRRAQGDFQTLLAQTRTVFTDLVQVNDMRNPDNCTLIFSHLRLAYERLAPEATNVALSDAQGNIYCAVNPVLGGRNIATKTYFQAAKTTLDLAVGDYGPSPLTGAPTLAVAYPVASFDGNVQTVMVVTFGLQWLKAWETGAALPAETTVTLLTPDRLVLQRDMDGALVEAKPEVAAAPGAWFTALPGGPTVVEGADLDGVRRVNIVAPLAQKDQVAAYLHLGYPVAPLYAAANRSLGWRLALLALTLVGALILAGWGSESLFLQPLHKLMQAVQQVQAGDLDVRAADVRGLSELTQLAQAFNQMTDALYQREADRQRAQAELERSEARFRSMFENSPAGINIMGLDRKVLDINPAMCRMLGYTREELVGQTPAMVTHPDDFSRSTQKFAELVSGQQASNWDERRYLRKNGEVFWAQITVSLVRDAAGRPLHLLGMAIDISEQRRILEELKESEARFRAVYENAAVGISLIAPSGQVLAANPVLTKLSGYTEAELIALGGEGITHPEDRDTGRAEFSEVLAGRRETYQVEKRYVCKEGGIYWMRQSISCVRDPAGQLLYVVAMAEDIDQQKRAAEELRESEARFRGMFESSAIGVVILDVNTLTFRTNAAARRLLDDPVTGRTLTEVHEFIKPDYRAAEREQFDDLVCGRCDTYNTERCYRRPGEEPKWAHVTLTAVRAAEGQLLNVVAMIEDITERKQAQATLQESEARFRAILDNAAIGVAVMTLDRRIVQVNQTAVRLTGYTGEELAELDPSLLAVDEDRYLDQALFQELVAGQRDQYTAEKRYRRKDGSVFWGRVNFSSVQGPGGRPLYTIGMIEDITEEKRAAERLAAQEAEHRRALEQRIAQRTQELNKANELLQQKAAQDAVTAERTRLARDLHDAVTQTLFSATLIADVLPDLWALSQAEGRRRLEELRQLTRGALAEMRTLLVELRPNALVEVPLAALLRQLAEAVTGRARISVQVGVEGERKLPAEVQVGLYRIAQEALNNVVKHARATQAVVTLRLGPTVRLTVSDNGSGFEPSNVTADHLGLKIMRERAEGMGAHFSVYSEPGEGTQISVTWE